MHIDFVMCKKVKTEMETLCDNLDAFPRYSFDKNWSEMIKIMRYKL